MACDSWRGRVEAYVDGELPESERRAFDAHLKSCASCAADALARLQQKRLTQAAGKRFSPSPEFRRRMEETLLAPRRPSFQGAWLRAWAPQLTVAAVLIVGLVALYGWRQASEREAILGEVADLHVTGLASSNPVDVVSSDRHTVKPWFQGRVPFAFDLPVVDGTPFTLLGGRMAYLRQSPAAHLVYQYGRHRISVFILRDTSAPALAGTSFRMRTWTRDGLRYVAVTDAAPEILGQLERVFLAP